MSTSECTTAVTDFSGGYSITFTLILYVTIGSVGFLGNSLVLIVMAYYKPMRQGPSYIYICNQSVLDLTVSSAVILTAVFQEEAKLSGFSGEAYCRLWLTKLPLWSLFLSSSYNLVAITVERYLSVVHVVWHRAHFGRRQVWASVTLAWVVGLGYNTAYMIPTARVENSGICTIYSVYPNITLKRLNGIFTIVLQFFIPLVILAFCYSRMALVFKSRVLPVSSRVISASESKGETSNIVQRSNTSRTRMNIIKTFAVVSICFVICWVWNQVYFLMMNLGYDGDLTGNFYQFTVVAVFCNCCINPFIYMARYKHFQQGLRKLLKIRRND